MPTSADRHIFFIEAQLGDDDFTRRKSSFEPRGTAHDFNPQFSIDRLINIIPLSPINAEPRYHTVILGYTRQSRRFSYVLDGITWPIQAHNIADIMTTD